MGREWPLRVDCVEKPHAWPARRASVVAGAEIDEGVPEADSQLPEENSGRWPESATIGSRRGGMIKKSTLSIPLVRSLLASSVQRAQAGRTMRVARIPAQPVSRQAATPPRVGSPPAAAIVVWAERFREVPPSTVRDCQRIAWGAQLKEAAQAVPPYRPPRTRSLPMLHLFLIPCPLWVLCSQERPGSSTDPRHPWAFR
jgi:hypothetical protein